METGAIGTSSGISASPRDATSAFSGEDFFQLLVAQLTNQDPFEPTSNEQLLQQISSIREIDLSTSLVDSLKTLTGQQRFGAAANLIGKHVQAAPDPTDPSGSAVSGVVVGMNFAADGQVVLQLGNGSEVALDHVQSINDAGTAATSLVGMMVGGVDSSDPSGSRVIQGLVMSVDETTPGKVMLELDTGEMLALEDVLEVESLEEIAAPV